MKWLGRITVRREPSENYFQTTAYRVLPTPDPLRPGDVSSGEALSTITLNSVILAPRADDMLVAGARFRMRGWAIGTDGSAITQVEYSLDDGATWATAQLSAERERWSWTQWDADVVFPPGRHTLAVRATDAAGHQQPAELREVWNVKGYLNNAWHRVTVTAAG
ncbi:MAG: hypothetical protein HC937_00890 [Aquincola sp.]|nr:hypothetical protein [Aquincola sp.]